MRLVLFMLIAALSLPVLAQDVPLPRPRPEPVATGAVPLPRLRPDARTEPEPVAEDKASAAEAVEPPAEPEPPKPPRIYQTACPAVLSGQVAAKALPPIAENQCAVQSPLAVTGVLANGRMIPLSGEAVLGCGMATALPAWVADVDSFVRARAKTGIASVITGTSYMCRNVNNGANGDLSFHAFALALDVVGFTLEDGRTVSVEAAWTGSEEQGSRIIRFAHDAACTHFTTTLGPEANEMHNNHLHVDLGCHGTSCTARLCE